MAAEYLFRDVTDDDIEYIAANMRQADIAEMLAAGDARTPLEALSQSVKESSLCVAVEHDRELLCIGGAAAKSLLSSDGIPWMLCAQDIERHSKLFLLHGAQCISVLLLRYAMLENYVDANNVKSIRWLKRMGFTIHKPMPHPNSGRMFCRFSISRQ